MFLGEIADIIFSFPEKGGEETDDWVYPAFLEENNIIAGIKTEKEMATNPLCKIKVGDIIIKRIYVGESENVEQRLKQHISDYDKGKEKFYWNTAVVFVDNRLDKAEIRYIENKFANDIFEIDPDRLLTKNTYNKTNLKDSQIAVAEEFAENAKTLLDALGMKLVEVAPQVKSKDQYLYCKGKEANAVGFISNNGFTVLKDSIISSSTTPSFIGKVYYYRLREKLIKEKIIVDYKFVKDYEFQAPSAASSIVLGRSSNGKTEWKKLE